MKTIFLMTTMAVILFLGTGTTPSGQGTQLEGFTFRCEQNGCVKTATVKFRVKQLPPDKAIKMLDSAEW